MHAVQTIDIKQNEDSIFKNLLKFLNSHRNINHVTLQLDNKYPSKQDLNLLATIAATCGQRLSFAITPPPKIDCSQPTYPLGKILSQTVDKAPSEVAGGRDLNCQQTLEDDRLDFEVCNYMEPVKILVTSIDFDGCADTQERKQRIIDDILTLVARYQSLKRIVILIGSLRQSVACDYMNAKNNAGNHNGELLSCQEIGTDFFDNLANALSLCNHAKQAPIIQFEPLMISDILNGFDVGETYEALHTFNEELKKTNYLNTFVLQLKNQSMLDLLNNSREPHVKHCLEWYDTSKVSTLLVQMHYIAKKYAHLTSKAIHFRFYDDRSDILENLYCSLNQGEMVPKQLNFDCALNEEECTIPYQPIIGQAMIVPNINEMLHYFKDRLPTPHQHPNLNNTLVSLYNEYYQKATILRPIARRSPACNLFFQQDNEQKNSVSNDVVMKMGVNP